MAAPAHRPLTVWEKIAYGLGDTASNFFFQFFNLFLLFYYTDVVGIAAASVGTLFLVARVYDAVLDPVIGVMADRTHTRWGQFRPWILMGAIPYGVFGYLMFVNPAFSPEGKLKYAYLTYIALMTAYSAINIPYSALMGVMSSSSQERTSLSSYRFICAFAGGFLVSSLVLPVRQWLGGTDQAAGFRATMGVFAVVSIGLLTLTFLFSREEVKAKPERTPIAREIKSLAGNTPWLILFFVAVASLTQVGARNASAIYYFKYYVGRENQTTWFLSSGMVALILGSMSLKWLLKLAERKTILIWLTVAHGLVNVPFYFLAPTSTAWMYSLNTVGSLLGGAMPAIVWSFYADTADYGLLRFGHRSTGLMFAAGNFANKVGLAFGGAIGGWLLSSTGFHANAAQSPQAIAGIKVIFAIVPAVLGIVSALFLIFYPLSEERVREMEKDLARGKLSHAL